MYFNDFIFFLQGALLRIRWNFGWWLIFKKLRYSKKKRRKEKKNHWWPMVNEPCFAVVVDDALSKMWKRLVVTYYPWKRWHPIIACVCSTTGSFRATKTQRANQQLGGRCATRRQRPDKQAHLADTEEGSITFYLFMYSPLTNISCVYTSSFFL